ncbi:MAG: Asp-tRNA(Asn)/Glu-tRNA(Gln) amidotransferase subunit GatA [Phycisphaerales bacterium]
MSILNHSILEIASMVRRREISAVAVVRASLDAAASRDESVGALLQLFPELALARAAEVDRAVASGGIGSGGGSEGGGATLPLAGVPVVLKDNICTNFGRTTCGSRYLEKYESPFTATAAQRLMDAGAIVIGKSNLDEFAMGSSTENSAFRLTRNPWDLSRVPGGSSGGSAAAVAAGMVPAALGSDTGGSVRQPASFCGLVGVKPTYGRVSRWGLVAYASSLDQIGPLTTSVPDAAAMLGVICGFDPLDSTSSDATLPDLMENLDTPIAGLRVGVPRQARSHANHPAVDSAMRRVEDVLRSAGAEVVEIDLPRLEHGIAAYYIVALAEASSNLARFDGVRYGRRAELGPSDTLFDLYAKSRAEGFGAEVRRRIMLGTYTLSSGYYDAYYTTALKARRLIKQDFDGVFGIERGRAGERAEAGVHAVLMPTAPTPAFRIGEKTSDPIEMYLEDIYTVPVNLAGICAMSVPGGFAEADGPRLPVGVQVICPAPSNRRHGRAASGHGSSRMDRPPGSRSSN